MSQKYQLRGINDEETVCSICGKIHLKRVMWIERMDEDGTVIGDAIHCGTTCGARLLSEKYSVSQMRTVVRNWEAYVKIEKEKLSRQHPNNDRCNEIINHWNNMDMSFRERMADPLYAKYNALRREIRDWVNSQPISMDL